MGILLWIPWWFPISVRFLPQGCTKLIPHGLSSPLTTPAKEKGKHWVKGWHTGSGSSISHPFSWMETFNVLDSESQEMDAIASAPENACKKIWGAWSIAPVKNVVVENNLSPFIYFQLHNNAPICLQIPSKVKLTMGKSLLLLWNALLFAMQNSSRGTRPREWFFIAPVKYPTGVIDSSHKYFSWPWLIRWGKFGWNS
jgi:hypothetical protein